MLARRINHFGHQGVNPLIKSIWSSFTIFMIACSGILLVSCILIVMNEDQSLAGSLFLILPIIIFFPIPIILEVYCYQAIKYLNEGNQFDLPESLQTLTLKIQTLGWISLGTPLLLFAPVIILAPVMILASLSFGFSILLFSLLILIFVIISSILNVSLVNKRANESELLWLLAICVEKNIPLAPELDTYSYTLSGKYRDKIQQLSSLLHSGFSLSEALSTIPGLVPQSAIVAARIGEKSNSLSIALRDSAVQTTKNLKTLSDRSNITSLILYLTVVVSIQFLISGFIMYWIIPKFKKIFLDFDVELPPMTTALIEISNFIIYYFYLFLPLFSIPLVTLALLYIGNHFGWYNLRIPFLTGWFPRLNTPICLRQIAQSISVQQTPQIALESVSEFHLWADVRKQAHSVNTRIKQGESAWDSLYESKVLTNAEAALCTAAERMGNLPYILRTLADTIELRRARKLRFLSELCKPILISLLGILVGFIVIALFMPLIKLLKDLS
ncbi:MAG: type II secretion system F family protein [Gimesia sp.]